MALSVVNSVSASAGSTNVVTTSGISITAGNLIVVGTANFDAGGVNDDVSVTDSVGNTYTSIGASAETGTRHATLWFAKNVTGGVSVTFSYNTTLGHNDFLRISVVQIAGADTSAPLDQGSSSTFATSGTSGTTLASPSITTLLANEILVAIGADSGATGTESFDDGSGLWVVDTSNTNTGGGLTSAFAHRIVSSTGTYSVTQTTSAAQGNRIVGIASFKASTTTSLSAGTLSLGTTTATTQALSLATDSGGTAPYSNQLQQAPDASGSPGTWVNVQSPQVGTTASWSVTGLAQGVKFWWRVVVTDNVSNTANSNQVTATTLADSVTAPSPASLVANTVGNVVSVTGVGTSWLSGTTWSVAGLTGAAVTAKTFTDATHYTLTITTSTTNSSGALTLTNNTDDTTCTITVYSTVGATGRITRQVRRYR